MSESTPCVNEPVIRYGVARRVTLLGALTNAVLGALKIGLGWLGHSAALVADGFHSWSDLLTDVLVLFAAKWSAQDPDFDHPYGHDRIETAATVGVAIMLTITALAIMFDALLHLFSQSFQFPHAYVLYVALFSIVLKETLYHATKYFAHQIQSQLLHANAWHHRSDAASSILVLVAVTGALMGFPWLDAVASIIVAMMILRMSWKLGWQNVKELVDTGVDPTLLSAIKNTTNHVPGVLSIHQLRTRSMRGNIFVDVHILVAPDISVSEGHFISEQVQLALRNELTRVTDVTVHVDPENDEMECICVDLPAREKLLPSIYQCLDMHLPAAKIHHIVLHYLGGEVHCEVILSSSFLQHLLQLKNVDTLGALSPCRESLLKLPAIAYVTFKLLLDKKIPAEAREH